MKVRRKNFDAMDRSGSETFNPATSMEPARLLVIEDEPDLQELLRYNLTRQHYDVTCTDRGERGLELARHHMPDLVLLDLMLPGMDGLEVCRALRDDARTSRIPVVMLTARDQEMDIVRGLEMGADDYVTKPYRQTELLARIRAALRRGRLADEAQPDEAAAIRLHNVVIDPQRHHVSIDKMAVVLTATEFKLLHLLARNPGRVFTRRQIIHAVHGELAAITERAVDVQVVSLRRKLMTAAQRVEDHPIETVRGIGYRFRE